VAKDSGEALGLESRPMDALVIVNEFRVCGLYQPMQGLTPTGTYIGHIAERGQGFGYTTATHLI
jgi:hypothetical protein